MIIYLSFFSISDFLNSSFFVIFSDKKHIAICIEQHHDSPFFNNEKHKRNKNTMRQKIFHGRASRSLFSLYRTHFFLFPFDFAVDFIYATYKSRKIIIKEKAVTTQRCINHHNFCMKGLHVAKTG